MHIMHTEFRQNIVGVCAIEKTYANANANAAYGF